MTKEGEHNFVRWFSELNNKDIPIAGGKGASLSEMYNAKVPVPPGFIVTAQAYGYFMKKTGLDKEVKEILSKVDVNDTAKLNEASKKIRALIEGEKLPKEMEEEIIESYDILDVKKEGKNALDILKNEEEIFVACRSSATTEDLVDASFAGQQDTFLNVHGHENLIINVKKCMSSLFTARAIYYRIKKGFEHDKALLAVVVQKMINSVKSGVMFSKNPTGNDDSIIIEAVWGLGEGIVSGQIKPDHYVVNPDLDNFEIKDIQVSKKKIAIIKNEDGNTETVKLKEERANQRVLDNYEIKRLAQYGKQLEEHYDKPQDIEFAIDGTGIFIVQSRPITTVFKASEGEIEGEPILTGLGASPGVGSGTVKIVHSLDELEKVKEGDVLVTEMTNPDMVVSMEKAAAIITDEGGITSHAAIVSREMGIPAVVGTGEATKNLKDGDVVTVDGSAGKVYAGKGETKKVVIEEVVPTKTEIKVIVDLPNFAERAAQTKIKKIGLTRLEGIIATSGKHPMKFVQEGDMSPYVKVIAEGIKKIVEPFEEVWIRTSDIRSDEYRELEGAAEEVEGNPMLGDHGVRFSLKHPEIMKAELMAVKEAAHHFPNKKFGIMMPQIISVSEVVATKKLAKEVGVPDNIHIGIMVETPAAVMTIEDFCKEGISFISFGSNDLTQYTLAIDRNNEEVQNIYDETHPAVLASIKHVISVCKKYGVMTSLCGQAGSRPEVAKLLVAAGIDSISTNADAARKVSEVVAEIEKNGGVASSTGPVIQSEDSPKENIEVSEVDLKVARAASGVSEDEVDIEDAVLKELEEDEYSPGDKKDGKGDIPSLNDAIPVTGEYFEGE